MVNLTQQLIKRHQSTLLSPALLITVSTAFGYLNALLFEIGYLNNYGINYQFAQVNTKIFILFGLSTVVVIYAYLTNIEVVSYWSAKIKPKSALGLWMYITLKLFIVVAVLFLPVAIYFNKTAIMLSVIAIMCLSVVVSNLFSDGKGAKGLNSKAEKVLLSTLESEDEQPGVPLFIIVIAAVLVLSMSAFMGKEFANTRRTYALTSDNYVVVRSYGDSFVLAQIDPVNYKLTGSYIFRNNDDDLKFVSRNMHLERH